MSILNKQHEYWMQHAFQEAMKAYQASEIPVGAVVVQDHHIIGRGYNQREGLHDPTAHAEIIAITSAANTIKDWRLSDCSLYVTKEPCSMCAGAVINARFKALIFGMYDKKEGCCGSLYQLCQDNRFKHQLSVKGGIMKDECKELMQNFFAKIRDKLVN
jgi:tRNA(adenine34) deaminase